MNEQKILELVHKIRVKSESGGLKWEKTASENVFQATLGNFVIRISRYSSSETPDPDYFISIIDKDGITLESIGDTEISRMQGTMAWFGGMPPFQVMESIFKHAKRQSLGVDKAIDDILSELG